MPHPLFQTLVNDVLCDKRNLSVVVLLHYILVLFQAAADLQQHMWQVLQRLLEIGNCVEPEPCELPHPSLSYLRFIIGQG